MALYLGSNKQKISLGSTISCLNIYTTTEMTNGVKLQTSDNYTLKDSSGAYITTKESE